MTPSLFSVSYAGLWGQARLDLPAFVRRAAQLGYGAVMLMGKRPHLSPVDTDEAALSSLADVLRESGVRCEAVAAYTDLAPAAAPEVPWTELQRLYVRELARAGQRLGARYLRVFTAYAAAGDDPSAAWDRVVKALREVCDEAARFGLVVAVQNHHDVGLDTDSLLQLRAEVDRSNCKLGFDAWSPALRGEDLEAAARKAAPHTVITTNADYIRVPRYRYARQQVNYERVQPDWCRAVRFGTGCIDYAAFFRGLKAGGFAGLANYEACSPLVGGGESAQLDAAARAYLEWLQANGLSG